MTGTRVVIVGAGPSGATAALLLAARGIRSVVLERRTAPLLHPAAHVISARTLEIWREYSPDLADRIAAMSPPRETVNLISWYGSLSDPPIGSLDLLSVPELLAEVESYSPYLVSHIGQHLLMPVLWEALDDEPLIDFRRGVAVTALTSDARGATVTATSADAPDSRSTVRGEYILACDGANSTLRDDAGIDLRGPVLANMGSAFFRSRTLFRDAVRPLLSWVYTPELCGVLIAHAAHHYIFITAYLHPAQKIARSSRDYWQQTLAGVLGTGEFEIESTGTWVMTSQTAEAFRVDRLLLLGDAAHRFPHTGGFGLNSGVQDAHNLAWKLEAILRGGARDALLDTYEVERRPVVERFADQSVTNHFRLDKLTRHVGVTNAMLHSATEAMRRPPLSRLPGRVLAPFLDRATRLQTRRTGRLTPNHRNASALRERVAAEIPGQIEHFVSMGLQFGYVYDGPLVISEASGETPGDTGEPTLEVVLYKPTTRPGARLPHVDLLVDGRVTPAHDALDRTGLTVFTFAQDQWRAAVPSGISVVALVPGDGAQWDRLIDLYEVGTDGAVVVRPDGHVFWRTTRTAADAAPQLASLIDARWGAYYDGRPTARSAVR
ncbi:FAD-dependent monooxygenase [Nocardia salmonicida]|uniref:FAD-dependent monooxygenase n=1 Tax=Nocardia salmonicida TaxID=53431 RepID=UPI00368708F4